MPRIVDWDIDAAESLCDDDGLDCVYWQTAKGPRGYYVTVVVDSETANFVDDLTTDDGPYERKRDADEAGFSAAVEWMMNNNVPYCEEDYKRHAKRFRRR
jgi:hypothetical protein